MAHPRGFNGGELRIVNTRQVDAANFGADSGGQRENFDCGIDTLLRKAACHRCGHIAPPITYVSNAIRSRALRYLLPYSSEFELLKRAACECCAVEPGTELRFERDCAPLEFERAGKQRRDRLQEPVHFASIVDAAACDASFHPAADFARNAVA